MNLRNPCTLAILSSACLLTWQANTASAQSDNLSPRTRESWSGPRPPDRQRELSPSQAPPGSVQVNLDPTGLNILNDAANEPTLAIDPTNPLRMAICWRQFDTIESGFRQAGYAYSVDGGVHWTNGGVIDPGQFRSDPVLAASPTGDFYFCSLKIYESELSNDLFVSEDGGATWILRSTPGGGDKPWMIADQTRGPYSGTIYFDSNQGGGVRSIDEGFTWLSTFSFLGLGTMSIGPNGEVYYAGGFASQNTFVVSKSTDGGQFFDFSFVNMGGSLPGFVGPNPEGLLGQASVAADPLDASRVYLLCSINNAGTDPVDVHFARSTDGGISWSQPVRLNDDMSDANWQWFGTMSVAPNGRIDVIWNDTRNSAVESDSQIYYAYSLDAGISWSRNRPITPTWNSHVGWPTQAKIGDYYHMISDNDAANLAYAATFNGEQDVYFARIPWNDCNRNGVPDDEELANGGSDCNANGVLDVCDENPAIDCNNNLIPDFCDIMSGAPDCNKNGVLDQCEPDYCPPDPNPMAFEIPPTPLSTSAIRMVAAEAQDLRSPPVRYSFLYTGGFGGHGASFFARDYVDTNLPIANWGYPYQVIASDAVNNATAASSELIGSTLIETPSGVLATNVTTSSMVLSANGTFTNVGLQQTGFYFELTPQTGQGANQWVTTPSTVVTGLQPGTIYRMRVKARNWQAFETPYSSRSHSRTHGGSPLAVDQQINDLQD